MLRLACCEERPYMSTQLSTSLQVIPTKVSGLWDLQTIPAPKPEPVPAEAPDLLGHSEAIFAEHWSNSWPTAFISREKKNGCCFQLVSFVTVYCDRTVTIIPYTQTIFKYPLIIKPGTSHTTVRGFSFLQILLTCWLYFFNGTYFIFWVSTTYVYF